MRMPMLRKPVTAVLAGLLLVVILAPAVAVADDDSTAAAPVLPGFRVDPFAQSFTLSADSPLLPWTPLDQMEDRKDAMRYWNAYYRGGRISFGVNSDYVTFKTVSTGTFNAATGDATLVENDINVAYGLVLIENLRLDLAVGTTLINFQPTSRGGAGYDVYGWGINYKVGLSFSPVLSFLPKMVAPEFGMSLRGYNAKNGSLGSMNTTHLRAYIRIYLELAGTEDFSLSIFVGGGYQFYKAFLNSLEFKNNSGGGADIPLPDLNFNVGLVAFLGTGMAIRLEGNNLPSLTLSLEVITQ
ncbi:MAG: hypothetical protein AB7K09_11180 [Planctomycetota bacterium]